MKVRNSFVSNSSSSSFIVIGQEPPYSHVKLSIRQGFNILATLTERGINNKYDKVPDIEWDPETEPMYLTPFISDGGDTYWQANQAGKYEEHPLGGWDVEPEDQWPAKTYSYCGGGHLGPYGEQDYNDIKCPGHWDSAWIRKEDDPQDEEDFVAKLYSRCNDDYLIILDEIIVDAGMGWKCQCGNLNMMSEGRCPKCKRWEHEN
jgi:hypothetical protein